MRQRTALLTGAAAGVAAAYFLDTTSGRRRRHRFADAVAHSTHVAADTTGKVARDLRNRSRGIIATTSRVFRRDEPSNEVLLERVRATLGRVASHPRAIDVQTTGAGHVVLCGSILESEKDRVLDAIGRVRGVNDVDARFDVHREPGNVPSLQGSARVPAS